MTGTRFLIAGLLMLTWCAWSGRRVRIGRQDALRLAVIGVLLLSVANVVVSYAERVVPTGLTALMVSTVPLWLLVIETWILRGDRLTALGMLGLPLGAVGIVVLLWPRLSAPGTIGWRELAASLSLLLAALSWAVGSVFSKRWPVQVEPFAASGWQMTFAGMVNLTMGAVLGEYSSARWTAQGLAAVAYLIVFGSWVGFSSYIWLLHHVPTPKVATYAYVNPVVAVFLGWLVLKERVDAYILAGTAIVVGSVALTTSAKVKTRKFDRGQRELPAVERAG
jgi:drug/metabolite transporter (DMT)-like permease